MWNSICDFLRDGPRPYGTFLSGAFQRLLNQLVCVLSFRGFCWRRRGTMRIVKGRSVPSPGIKIGIRTRTERASPKTRIERRRASPKSAIRMERRRVGPKTVIRRGGQVQRP